LCQQKWDCPFCRKDGRYYLYPTLNGKITAVTADSPQGPFRAADGKDIVKGSGFQPFPITKGTPIDAEVFVDDDGQAYMVWAQRGICKLKSDLTTPDGEQTQVKTKRGGYSEGPFLFKRKGIYYYLYTLEGHENYKYAYMMSHTSPMGPWEEPEEDIISKTDHEQKIFGPGHGCFFRDCPNFRVSENGTVPFSSKDAEQWYFAYLEFGRGGTNRQVWVDKMNFNADGTIQPVKLTLQGVGALRPAADNAPNLALGKTATASSTQPDLRVKPIADQKLDRTENFAPANALDGSNGTRWMAMDTDAAAWYQLDLGEARDIKRTEVYFVKPTAGHAYRLEYSLDGKTWSPYGGHDALIAQSPHTDANSVRARYLKLTFIKGTPGIWEFRVY
jgi:Glycosyl hydrolases family 43/F5/8 type C domain